MKLTKYEKNMIYLGIGIFIIFIIAAIIVRDKHWITL